MKDSFTDSAQDTAIINYVSVIYANSHKWNRTVTENKA
jgi:hypothetical protein